MARLARLSIEHFRGFLGQQQFDFAVPDQRPGSGLTHIVGPNNVGKSTVVEALRYAVSPPGLIDRKERHVGYAVRISITDTNSSTKALTNPSMAANITHTGSADPHPQNFRYVPSRRPWSSLTGTHQIGPGDYWTNKSRNGRSEDGELVGRLNSFPPEEKAAYQAVLTELLPQLSNWNIEYSDGRTYLEYTTLKGSQHNADLFGDGVASLFRIALALYDPANENVIVIDEPELSLHPQAQKRLAELLSKKSSDRQIIVCTHSPYFVSWRDLVAGGVVYRLKQTRDGIIPSRLSALSVRGLENLFEDWQKPQLLDPVAREVFFAEEVVFLRDKKTLDYFENF